MSQETSTDEQKTERFNMFLSPSEMKAIDEWAWKNRIRSKSEAVRRLCQIGLVFDDRQVDLVKRSERALKALIAGFEKTANADVEKMPPKIRASLSVAIGEQREAYRVASQAGIATSLLSVASGEIDALMQHADEVITLLDRKSHEPKGN